MLKQALYNDLAQYYDVIYESKDYKMEVENIKNIVSDYKQSSGNKLLEVACGTGGHTKYLKKDFEVFAIDLNSRMLDIARKNMTEVRFEQADMVDFNLGQVFDVITCLFCSISYAKSYSNLQRTLENFARHLKPGGVVIIEPWLSIEEYEVGRASVKLFDSKDTKIVSASVSKISGNISVVDINYLVAEPDKKVKHIISKDELGMFETDKFIEIMESVGLKTKFIKEKHDTYGFFIGLKL